MISDTLDMPFMRTKKLKGEKMRNVNPIIVEEFERVRDDPQISVKYVQCSAQELRTVICAVLSQSYVEHLSESGEEA